MWVLTESEALFYDSYKELQQRLAAPTRYNLLKASSLVRQLLVDGSPLVDTVNRLYSLKISFDVSNLKRPSDFGLDLTFQFVNPSPHDFRGTPTKAVSKREFLRFEVLQAHGRKYSILDLIKHCAHRLGGVHYEPPGARAEGELRTLGVQLGGKEAPVEAIRGIGAVVLRALLPLQACLEARELHVGLVAGLGSLPAPDSTVTLFRTYREAKNDGVKIAVNHKGIVTASVEDCLGNRLELSSEITIVPNVFHTLLWPAPVLCASRYESLLLGRVLRRGTVPQR